MKTQIHNSNSHRFLSPSVLMPLALSLSLVVSGCATRSPDFADSVASEGDQYSAISDKWADGQKLVSKGEKRIRKGREQIKDGNENISEGEAMMRRGKRLMTESEEEYRLKKEF
ncbi:hypothetical protein ACUNV4_06735 [Granulosicoccus sp. 3-233]|uniref:hypothetical protein n=1 Tax=Granulosicoccus sp. 3-233 TaxID=3417969 RepID=UPI003D34F80D